MEHSSGSGHSLVLRVKCTVTVERERRLDTATVKYCVSVHRVRAGTLLTARRDWFFQAANRVTRRK